MYPKRKVRFFSLFSLYTPDQDLGHTLEETALIFDGAGAVQDLQREAEDQLALDKGRNEVEAGDQKWDEEMDKGRTEHQEHATIL